MVLSKYIAYAQEGLKVHKSSGLSSVGTKCAVWSGSALVSISHVCYKIFGEVKSLKFKDAIVE